MRQAGGWVSCKSGICPAASRPRARPEEIVKAAADAGLYTNLITAAVDLSATAWRRCKLGLDHVQNLIPGPSIRPEPTVSLRLACLKEARSRPLGYRARHAADDQHPFIGTTSTTAALHRHGGRTRRAASRSRSRAQYSLGLSQPRGPDPHHETVASIEYVETARERLKGVLTIDMVVPDYYAKRPKPCMGGWGKGFMNITGRRVAVPRGRNIPELHFDNVRDHGRSSRRHLDELRRLQRFPGTDWMKEPCKSCAFRESRFRRLPLPSDGHHQGPAQHRPRMLALALSRGDGEGLPRKRPHGQQRVRLPQHAQRRRSRQGAQGTAGSGGVDDWSQFEGALIAGCLSLASSRNLRASASGREFRIGGGVLGSAPDRTGRHRPWQSHVGTATSRPNPKRQNAKRDDKRRQDGKPKHRRLPFVSSMLARMASNGPTPRSTTRKVENMNSTMAIRPGTIRSTGVEANGERCQKRSGKELPIGCRMPQCRIVHAIGIVMGRQRTLLPWPSRHSSCPARFAKKGVGSSSVPRPDRVLTPLVMPTLRMFATSKMTTAPARSRDAS